MILKGKSRQGLVYLVYIPWLVARMTSSQRQQLNSIHIARLQNLNFLGGPEQWGRIQYCGGSGWGS